MQTLTRRALFDLVWAHPLTKIAADFGISNVALHKICDKHRVPLPGRGYWAKLAASQKVPKALQREGRSPFAAHSPISSKMDANMANRWLSS